MGGCNSKKTGKRLRYIPPNSPLGELLVKWDSIEATEGLDKVKMMHYCMEVWPELELQGRWPWCGTKDKWMCQQLNNYLTARGDTDPEQLLYVACWLKSAVGDEGVRICKVQRKKEGNEGGDDRTSKRWDPLDYLPPSAPPPYNPLLQAPQMAGPVLLPAAISLPPAQTPPSTSSASAMINPVSPPATTPSQPLSAPPVPSAPPQVPTPPAAFSTPSPAALNIHLGSSPPPIAVPLPPPSWGTNASSPSKQLSANTPADGQNVQGNPDIPQSSLASEDGPYCSTRSKTSKAERLFPLREVPMEGIAEGIGFVNAPLTASEVRGFKKELGHLVEDPVDIANQVDQFLGPNIYTWGEMNLS
nr:YLP motif-containing protein 1-like [Zonotrichia albicollis]